MGREWDDTAIVQPPASGHGAPLPSRSRPPRKRFLPHTWQDAMYAAIGLFFVSLSAPLWVLAWRLWGGHF